MRLLSFPLAVFVFSLAVPVSAASTASVLPFMEDDYAGAMKRAQAKKLPVFVEAWAPW